MPSVCSTSRRETPHAVLDRDCVQGVSVNLCEIAASAGERTGVIWTLEGSSDLNANLVRFETGRGVGEHVNDEVDVLIVGVSGSGFVGVDGDEHPVSSGH